MMPKIAITMAMTALLLSSSGCTSSREKGPTNDDASSEESGVANGTDQTESEGSANEPGPTYAIDCDGEVTALGVGVRSPLSPKCEGGEPGTKGCGDQGACAPQRVAFTRELPALRCASEVFHWDGAACVAQWSSSPEGQLRCTGEDCPSLYIDEAACEAAHVGCAGN